MTIDRKCENCKHKIARTGDWYFCGKKNRWVKDGKND